MVKVPGVAAFVATRVQVFIGAAESGDISRMNCAPAQPV
jgi:hypothetical protein